MTPAIIPAAIKMQGQQNSATTGGGGGGAFNGISAADTGRIIAVKLNNNANPIAKMPRRMVYPRCRSLTISGRNRAAQAVVMMIPI
jgi:hypothetical protein